jgi:hypothetical protein
VSGAGTGLATSHTPTVGAGLVTVRQVLDKLLAHTTQQLTTALPNWVAMPNGVAQLQALLQDVLTCAEAQRLGITTRPILWTPPGSPGDENFPPALYVGAPGEYAVGGADPKPLLSLTEPAARAMLARRLRQLLAHTGIRLNERVRRSIFNTGAREIWVNGKPLEGVAILDTGAMPLLIERAGMRQMGWTDKDAVPNAVRLGLADGLHQLACAYPEDSEVRVQLRKPHKNLNRNTGGGDGRTVQLSGGQHRLVDHWRYTGHLAGGLALPSRLAQGAQSGRRQGGPGLHRVYAGPWAPSTASCAVLHPRLGSADRGERARGRRSGVVAGSAQRHRVRREQPGAQRGSL